MILSSSKISQLNLSNWEVILHHGWTYITGWQMILAATIIKLKIFNEITHKASLSRISSEELICRNKLILESNIFSDEILEWLKQWFTKSAWCSLWANIFKRKSFVNPKIHKNKDSNDNKFIDWSNLYYLYGSFS